MQQDVRHIELTLARGAQAQARLHHFGKGPDD
jgi:hypothetical protein